MEFILKRTKNLKSDFFSGLTVALALVPEAVAFAFVAGVDPLVGLYAAFIVGFITSIFGGRPGMISGATGALAVVMVGLVSEGNEKGLLFDSGIENAGLYYLFLAVILMGLLQICFGFFKLGKLIRLIPHPVMLGFVNGLAIVIFLAQLGMFKDYTMEGVPFIEGGALYLMIGLILLTMGLMWGIPKLNSKLPSGLIAIVVVSGIVIFSDWDVATVGSFIKDRGGDGLQGGWPSLELKTFSAIPLNWDTLLFIFPYSLILASIGLIESLMTLNLVDELTESRGSGNRESVALGVANVVAGLFGGMGGCAMIGQSMINIQNGGRGRFSGIVAALALLVFVKFASAYIEMIPIAALVGVMFMVVIGTFAWSSFNTIGKIPISDALVIVIVSALTVIFDLAIAVVAGVIISSLVFAWESAKRIRARKSVKEDGTKVYEIWGPLFFGSINTFSSKFEVSIDPESVEIDFMESKIADHSGIEAVIAIVGKYNAAGKSVKLKHLSEDCKKLICKVNPELEGVIVADVEDPRYYVVTDVMKVEE